MVNKQKHGEIVYCQEHQVSRYSVDTAMCVTICVTISSNLDKEEYNFLYIKCFIYTSMPNSECYSLWTCFRTDVISNDVRPMDTNSPDMDLSAKKSYQTPPETTF